MNKPNRFQCFDVLKAIAIIAVILYHLGVAKYGYLGVDVFLVVAGYFTANSIERIVDRRESYLRFLINKVFRLLPCLLIASCFCLLYGYKYMLPDDYENLAQSVIATNFFANKKLFKDYFINLLSMILQKAS